MEAACQFLGELCLKYVNRWLNFKPRSHAPRGNAYQNVKIILDQLKFYKKAHKYHRDYQLWQEGIQPKQIHSVDMMDGF